MSRLRVLVAFALVVAAGSVFALTRAGGSALPPYLSYAVKFTCGEFGKLQQPFMPDVPEGPVKPGDYQTVISIHNPSALGSVTFLKKAVLLYAGANPISQTTHEIAKAPGPGVTKLLLQDYGMRIDCQDIRAVLLPTAPAAPTFIEGYVILQDTTLRPLDVTALYTAHGYNCVTPPGGAGCSTLSVTREGFTEHVLVVQPTQVNQ